MFLRLKFPLAAFLTGFLLAATGCGDGTNAEPTIRSDSDFTLPAEPAPELSASALTGEIEWDFMLAGSGDSFAVYRTKLATRSRGLVQNGDTAAVDLVVNGLDIEDSFAPAVVTVGNGRVTIHNRIDGKSYPLVTLQEQWLPCGLSAVADKDLEFGLVYVTLAASVEECVASSADAKKSFGVSFGEGGVRVWKALNGSRLTEVVFTADGEVDIFVVSEPDSKVTRLYSREGRVLADVRGSYRVPQIRGLGPRGVTRDDRYLGILVDGRYYMTTASRFIESGVGSLTPALSGLSLSSSLSPSVGIYQNRLALLQDSEVVYGIDQLTRNIRLLADFSDRFDEGFDDAFFRVIDETLVAVLNAEQGDSGESRGEVWTVDLSGASEPDLILEAESNITLDVFSGTHAYLRFEKELPPPPEDAEDEQEPEPEYAAKTLIVGSGGEPRIVDGSTSFFYARNSAPGGEERKIVGLRSDAYSLEKGFIDPELWTVNAETGQYGQMVRRLSGSCVGFDGVKALFSRMHVYSVCDARLKLGVLDTELGTLDYFLSERR